MAGTRLFIQEGIYDKFVARLLEMLKTWVVGDPFDPNVNQGPQVWFRTSIFMTLLLFNFSKGQYAIVYRLNVDVL